MAHYALIEDNIVLNVIKAESDFISSLEGEWVQTSYNTYAGVHLQGGVPLRANYASVGYTYNRELDVFYAPQPFPSWSLNATSFIWEPPIQEPDDGNLYTWSEDAYVEGENSGWVLE